jgi:putative nucleotidyltransferase with HDIG domain
MPILKNNSTDWKEPVSNCGLFPANILVVDDDALVREMLVRKLASLGYASESCEDGQLALGLLKNKRYDLVLADAVRPEIGGAAFLKEAMAVCPDIAVILTTSVVDIEIAVDSLKDGAYDWITKPFSLEEVTISIARALEKRRLLIENRNYERNLEEQVASRTSQLQEALKVLEHTYHSTLVALSKALDSRDRDADGRSLRITLFTKRIGTQLGLNDEQLRVLEQGALLHDIGKIGIPDGLLKKYDGFSDIEQNTIAKHPAIGYRILSSIKFLQGAARIVLHHHERYDGTGYPQRLRGDEIDRGARILAIADAFEYFTSNASKAGEIDFDRAIQEIRNLAGTHLDPNLVKEFLKIQVQEWKEIRKDVAPNTKRTDFLQRAV